MTITEILNADVKEINNDAKVAKLAEIIAVARKAYGNTEAVIASPMVSTTEGRVDIKYLTSADKVALAAQEVRRIRTQAIETTNATDGTVLDREIERLLAVNSTLVNLTSKSESSYI